MGGATEHEAGASEASRDGMTMQPEADAGESTEDTRAVDAAVLPAPSPSAPGEPVHVRIPLHWSLPPIAPSTDRNDD